MLSNAFDGCKIKNLAYVLWKILAIKLQLNVFIICCPAGLRDEMRAFEIDKVTSRKTIERLLEEFGGASKR